MGSPPKPADRKPGRPPKPDGDRKGDQIRVRVTEEQKVAFAKIADRAGLDVSAWLRSLGLREVQRAEREMGETAATTPKTRGT